MKMHWVSNAPWAFTGYGTQMRLLLPRFADMGNDCSITAYYGHDGSPINWGKVKVYGRGAHAYGIDIMAANAGNFGADFLCTNMDVWVIEPPALRGFRWVAWLPVDHEPAPPMVLSPLRFAHTRLTCSKFGQQMLAQAGLDSEYVPYCIDVNEYFPMNKAEARAMLGFPADKFIVGMVAMNKGFPPRKNFYQQIQAFTEFRKKHPDSMLYLHTDDGTHGMPETVNLVAQARAFGLKVTTSPDCSGDIVFPDPYSYRLGYMDAGMRALYNAFDVHLLASAGEGFGIPLVEAQACGCPVITGNWTGNGELLFGGWHIEKAEAEPFYTQQGAYWYIPHIAAIVDRLEMAYRDRDSAITRARAIEGAAAYDVNTVMTQYWQPVLDRLQAEAAPAQIPARAEAAHE